MRWSLRRGNRDAEGDAPPAPGSGAPAAADPGWTALPPIASTWSASTPLTVPATTPRPPLLTEPPRRARVRPLDHTDDGSPEPGRVVGLAAVVQHPPITPVRPAAEPVPYLLDQPPLRHAPARPLREHPALTEAGDAFLGEPLAPAAPATPPPAPSRAPAPPAARPEPPVEAATEAGARFREALANLHRSGLPRYVSPSEAGARPPEPATGTAAHPVEPVPPGGPDDAPRLTHRRNTLAQSRRLGLGAPLRPGAGEGDAGDDDGTDDGGGSDGPADAEPARAVAPPPPPVLPVPEPREVPAPPAATPSPAEPGPSPGRSALAPVVVPARPIADGTARPTAAAGPLVFRSRPPRAGGAPAGRAPERAVVSRPPAELAQALRASHGIEVADVEVRRDAATGHEARQRQARAFTRGGRVHLPEEAGPLTAGGARSLLVHELVHVAQQRRLGAALPAESTPEGRALEAEALAAERAYGGTPALTADGPLRHAPAPVSAGWVEDRITQHALDLSAPPTPYQLSDQQLYEVRYAAQEVVKDAAQSGWLGGALGGAAGGAAAGTIGIGGAHNWAEFEPQMLRAINLERREHGLAEVSSLSELSQADQRMIRERFDELYPAARQQQLREELRRDLGLPPTGQGGGTSWTPQAGFQLTTGAPGPTGTGTGGTTTPSTGGLPTGTGTTPGTTTTAPTPTAPRTTPGRGRGEPPQGVGIGQARTEEQFLSQALMAINVQRDLQGLGPLASVADIDPSDREMLHTAWQAQSAQLREQQARYTFSQAMRQQAEQQGGTAPQPTTAPTTGTGPAPTTGSPAPTTGTHVTTGTGAQGLRAGNVTAMGHEELSLDALDLTELSVRIYDRLRSRLRTELLVDRERAGLLTDFR